MSGGEPSSIKQKPSCAADLPILSPKCGKAAGCVYSNYLCAVLWGAERISIETTVSIEGDVPSPVNPAPGCRFAGRCASCMEICRKEQPELREVEPGHFAACHLIEQ